MIILFIILIMHVLNIPTLFATFNPSYIRLSFKFALLAFVSSMYPCTLFINIHTSSSSRTVIVLKNIIFFICINLSRLNHPKGIYMRFNQVTCYEHADTFSQFVSENPWAFWFPNSETQISHPYVTTGITNVQNGVASPGSHIHALSLTPIRVTALKHLPPYLSYLFFSLCCPQIGMNHD